MPSSTHPSGSWDSRSVFAASYVSPNLKRLSRADRVPRECVGEDAREGSLPNVRQSSAGLLQPCAFLGIESLLGSLAQSFNEPGGPSFLGLAMLRLDDGPLP